MRIKPDLIAAHNTNYAERETNEPLYYGVRNFMQAAGQTTNKLNAEQACLYTGLQLEEMAEKLVAVAGGCVSLLQGAKLMHVARQLTALSEDFKAGLHTGDILRSNHADLIDADIDLAWVSLGALLSTSPRASNAIAHCTFTNFSKFPGGVCTRDANGKVMKPADWRQPDFTPYVDKTSRD